jgi:hypothetical protein
MAWLIYVQHIDTTYDSVDFDDFIFTLSYFRKLDHPLGQGSEEETNQKYENLMLLLSMVTERGLEKSAQVQVHQIMKSTAEKIHGAFRELNRDDSFLVTSILVMDAMKEANSSLSHMMVGWLEDLELSFLMEGASDVYNIDWT